MKLSNGGSLNGPAYLPNLTSSIILFQSSISDPTLKGIFSAVLRLFSGSVISQIKSVRKIHSKGIAFFLGHS